ncbi:MAG TPA: hypothetical protein VIH90_00685 [Candidatus Saccharimonadales bacterium]
MINDRYVSPVGLSTEPYNAETDIPTTSELEATLHERGVNVSIGETLKGGTVSQVYAANEDGRPVVVKHTGDVIDTDQTVYFIPRESHYVDTKMLKFLAANGSIRVPELLHDFADVPVSVMEDLRASGFTLLNDLLVAGKFPTNAAANIGTDIAEMMLALASHEEFETVLSGRQNYYERGLELRHTYPNDQAWYTTLEKRFTTANQQLIAVDTHPKNTFIDNEGNAAWIDFGFSAWADRDFALPNGLAHIAVYALTGHIQADEAKAFIETAVGAYRKLLPIEDEVFCTYFAAEVLHRWAGKWIVGVDNAQQKLKLLQFGMKVFDKEMFTLDSLGSLLVESA